MSGQGQRHADDLTSNQEVVVRNIGTQFSRVAGIEGATVIGTGQVVLIINPVHLAARGELLHHVAGFVKQRRSAA